MLDTDSGGPEGVLVILFAVGLYGVLALIAGCLTDWILHRFLKILDRRQLLAQDSKTNSAKSNPAA